MAGTEGACDSYFRGKEAEPAAPVKVLPMEPTTYLEAARIMATVPYSKREVMNILKHLIPDIDAGATTENPALPIGNKEETKSRNGKSFTSRAFQWIRQSLKTSETKQSECCRSGTQSRNKRLYGLQHSERQNPADKRNKGKNMLRI